MDLKLINELNSKWEKAKKRNNVVSFCVKVHASESMLQSLIAGVICAETLKSQKILTFRQKLVKYREN